ncbi:hypothetical protein ACP70R_048710 [Stipagrostis hirtigluma subsp. patula]
MLLFLVVISILGDPSSGDILSTREICSPPEFLVPCLEAIFGDVTRPS